MKVKITKPIEIDFRYLKAHIGARYWADCEYSKDNGKTWICPEGDSIAEIPFINSVKDRCGITNYWDILIDLEKGKVVDWPKGFCIRTFFKVCDDGEYSFLDSKKNEVINITREHEQYYVPDFLSIDDDGWGDYVYITVNGNGSIKDFQVMKERVESYFEELIDHD